MFSKGDFFSIHVQGHQAQLFASMAGQNTLKYKSKGREK